MGPCPIAKMLVRKGSAPVTKGVATQYLQWRCAPNAEMWLGPGTYKWAMPQCPNWGCAPVAEMGLCPDTLNGAAPLVATGLCLVTEITSKRIGRPSAGGVYPLFLGCPRTIPRVVVLDTQPLVKSPFLDRK